MLTSSANQYLRPEYLTPLPTTLDAKKSPLALLAQTCSQIGADSPPTKTLLPPLDKSSKSGKAETPREKTSPASTSSDKPSAPPTAAFKPYESSTPRERTTAAASPEERSGAASRSRTPARGSTTPGTRCASGASAASPRASPAVAVATSAGRRTPASATGTPLPATDPAPAPAATATKERAVSPALKGSTPFGASFLSDPALKDIPLGTYKPSSYLGYGAHFPSDLSLLAPHHLKPGASLSPYMSYARMKSAAGAESLVPVCRDPYCSGCQLNSHLLASSGAVAAAVAAAAAGKSSGACPGGCAQCEHAGKAVAAAAAAAASGASGSAAGFLPSAGGHAAAFAHAQLAALAAASQLPYVCSWIAGDAAYCGKRFASSEELLQHLRSHTALGAAADALLGSGAPPPPSLLPRAYPTPPLSPLAAARFHPYSKPALLPASLGLPLHAHPALPPYFSPYALYGQRLGAAAASSMHP